MKICKECDKSFRVDSSFNKHMRSHKMSLASYFQKHFPRYDKYDNSFIKFKNEEFYLTSDFNSKENLKLWLDSVSQEEARAYLQEYLVNRKIKKKLIYAPSQVELRSLPIPGIKYFNELFKNYNQLCADIGYKIKYDRFNFSLPIQNLTKNKILIDTREQTPLSFSLKTKSECLPFGDYKLDDDIITHNCYIERKSLSDFYGTLSSGLARFKREIQRALDAKCNFIILIESPFQSVYEFIKQPHIRNKVRISPEFIFRNMRELIKEFPFIQFLFVENRNISSRIIEKIFGSNGEYKNCDLQLMYDLGNL